MILTESNFNRIKDEKSYNLNLDSYQTAEEFNDYVNDTLETENINILINNIIRMVNIINGTDEDNTEFEIKELILKVNLSKNRDNFEKILTKLDDDSDEKIIKINRIFDRTLLNNLGNKIDLLIKIEKLCEYFYPDFSDRLSMQSFKEVIKEKNISVESKRVNMDYSTLNITELCKKITDEQQNSLIECLSKDEFFLINLTKYLPKNFNKKDKK